MDSLAFHIAADSLAGGATATQTGVLIRVFGNQLYFQNVGAPLLVALVIGLITLWIRLRGFAHAWQLALAELEVAADRMWEHIRQVKEKGHLSASELYFVDQIQADFHSRCRKPQRSAKIFEVYQLMHQFNYNIARDRSENAIAFALEYYDTIRATLVKQAAESRKHCWATLVRPREIGLKPPKPEWGAVVASKK